jgi:hypothetical protein
MSVVRGDRLDQRRRGLNWPSKRRSVERDSWNDLTTAGTPEFLNSKAGEILSKSPQQTPSFFFSTYIAHAVCGRASTLHRILVTALTCLPGIFMHPHRMDDRGSAKHLWETTGV